MDIRNSWSLSRIGTVLGLSDEEMSDAAQDCLPALTRFYSEASIPAVIIYYTASEDTIKPPVFTTDGSASLSTSGVFFFVRLADRPIPAPSVADDTFFGYTLGDVLSGMEGLLTTAFIPALRELTVWGRAPVGAEADFFAGIEQYAAALSHAAAGIADTLTLEPLPPALTSLATAAPAAARAAAAADPALAATALTTLRTWTSQVAAFLADANAIRVESGAGPAAEVGHWRHRTVVFHAVLDQLRAPATKAVVAAAQVAAAPEVKQWGVLAADVTAGAGEARANLRYLQTLERLLESLYHGDPRPVRTALPGIVTVLQAVRSIAPYYASGARLESLFTKVTTQIIICCRTYLWACTEEGRPPRIAAHASAAIWQCDVSEMLRRIDDCLELNKLYQEHVKAAKESAFADIERVGGRSVASARPGSGIAARPASATTLNTTSTSTAAASTVQRNAPFAFSEVAVYGDFDDFSRRLLRLRDIFTTSEQFGVLAQSAIPGLASIASAFTKVIADMRRRPYDLLDHRAAGFDSDYATFTDKVVQLEERLAEFVSQVFTTVTSSHRALDLLEVFSSVLQRERLRTLLDAKYEVVFSFYEQELEQVRKTYEACKASPALPRATPPVAGNILWARALHARAAAPLERLRAQAPEQLETPSGQRAIRIYNSMTKVLVEFQNIWAASWTEAIRAALDGLRAPLLLRNPTTHALRPNLDPAVLQLCDEAAFMRRLNLPVPDDAAAVLARTDGLVRWREAVTEIAASVSRVQVSVAPSTRQLLAPILRRMVKVVAPGCTQVTWSSLSVDAYVAEASRAVALAVDATDKVRDIIQLRIVPALHEIADTCLLYVPGLSEGLEAPPANGRAVGGKGAGSAAELETDTIPTAAEWLQRQREFAETAAASIAVKSTAIAQAAEDCAMIVSGRLTADGQAAHRDVIQAFTNHWWQHTAAAVHVAVEQSLRLLSGRLARMAPLLQRIIAAPAPTARAASARPAADAEPTACTFVLPPGDPASAVCTLPPAVAALDDGAALPLFRIDVRPGMPRQRLAPDWGTVTTHVSDAMSAIINACTQVPVWPSVSFDQSSATDPAELTSAPFTAPLGSLVNAAAAAAAAAAGTPTSLGHMVTHSLPIAKMVLAVKGGLRATETRLGAVLAMFDGPFGERGSQSREATIAAFLETKPVLADYEERLAHFSRLAAEVSAFPSLVPAHGFVISTQPLRAALLTEIEGWRREYGRLLNSHTRALLQEHTRFVEDTRTVLQRRVVDIDDVGTHMESLSAVQRREAELDRVFGPIEEGYATLQRYGLRPPQEEVDTVDTLRYDWRQLIDLSNSVRENLSALQSTFRGDLVEGIKEFQHDVAAFEAEYAARGPQVPGVAPAIAAERVREYQSAFEVRDRKREAFRRGEELFGLPITQYPGLDQVSKDLKLLGALYGLYVDVLTTVKSYGAILWTEVNFDVISTQIQEYQARCRRLPKSMRDWPAFVELSATIDGFVTVLPLLQMLRHPAVRARHWARVSELVGETIDVTADGFRVQTILEAPLLKAAEDIEDVCNAAVKEADIETRLQDISATWTDQEFAFAAFKNRGDLTLKPDATSELISLLEDAQMVMSSLVSSRYNAPFKTQIVNWVQKLSTASEVLELWLQVQNLWVYLEAVFSGGDIARQLPQEAKRFASVDKHWTQIMATATQTPNVIHLTNVDETLRELLPHILEHLELCQKSLSGYLETKRNSFPRFYFVSETQLLEILGQQSDPSAIQPHLSSIFDSVHRVTFDKVDRTMITHLNSAVGDVVALTQPVQAQGNIETWLNRLVDEMGASVHETIREAAVQCDVMSLQEFIDNFSAQTALLGIQFSWTRLCESALSRARTDKMATSTALKSATTTLNTLVEMTKRDLTPQQRTMLETLITIQVHSRDITEHLVKTRTRSPADFEWTKQTRFYWDMNEDDAVVRITDINFRYSNEFLGNYERLCITPLTDRCYITLAQALGMKLGGAPAGPAGTGKTETVKDLGRCIGTYVVVINASNEMDTVSLGRLFRGTAQAGSWLCQDEFNRVELPVLSVAAQQVGSIFAALKANKPDLVFTDGDTIPVKPSCGFFITMNPGYAGRQELPENLKVLFRSVAMTRPDKAIIMRVKLAAAGFLRNMELSQKFNILYNLCGEQLSKSVHYDWGLRNILSVLRTCGGFRRREPSLSEDQVLMATLRDMNLSKLIHQDEPLFISLIDDLFPDLDVAKATYPDVEAAIERTISANGLVAHEPWVAKVVQLHETAQVRHGIMILGPSGAGKSACIDTLAAAYTSLGAETRTSVTRMNPKAITCPQMFGLLDAATNDWKDGIFSAIWRRLVKRTSENNWLVLDGPVDTIWIESLNTVLDDNKTLTLANGDRIPMGNRVKLIFEMDSLANASPATVSRAGMIYVSDLALGWQPVFTAWCNNRGDAAAAVVQRIGEACIPALVEWFTVRAHPVIRVPLLSPVQNMLRLMDALLPEVAVKGVGNQKPLADTHVAKIFTFCLFWAFGGLLESADREGLSAKIVQLADTAGIPLPPLPRTASRTTVFDFMVNDLGEWVNWSTLVPAYEYPRDHVPEFTSIVVPTVDIVRTSFLVDKLITKGYSPLLVGESGTAKTVTMDTYLARQDPEAVQCRTINFSSETSPIFFQRTVESFVEKRMGTTYGPPAGRRGMCFIDNINIIEPNEWGDTPTAELLRQMIEYRGFYSLDRPGEWVGLADMHWAGAMPHAGGGVNDIPMRLKRHLVPVNITLPSEHSIAHIYSAIIEGYFIPQRGFATEVTEAARGLVSMTHSVWSATKTKMLPTPDKFHYVFNLRDFSRVVQGVLRATPDVVTTPTTLYSLWTHEMQRVMPDKFTNLTDKQWFDRAITDVLTRDVSAEVAAAATTRPCYWADFMRDAQESEDPDVEATMPRIYDPVTDSAAMRKRIEEFMLQYNEVHKRAPLDLVLFDEAVEHICRIARILSTPRVNALLVGVGGSGKQSLARLASFIAGCETFTLTVSRNYTESNLQDDLKNLYRTAGVAGKGTTFLFTDADIKSESFLEYINNMLTSGQVPGLFARDEVDQITNDLRPAFKKAKPRVPDTNDAVWSFFLERCQRNLHTVLCFSPVGDAYRQRARKFPGLVSGCTTDWFLPWPYEALVEVGSKFMRDVDIVGGDTVKQGLVKHFAKVHTSVAKACDDYFTRYRRHAYVTPKSFLLFIQGFIPLYQQKRAVLGELHTRLTLGLEKLDGAARDVATMKIDLQRKEVDLKVAQERAAEMLKEITSSTAIAERKRAEVQVVKDELQEVSERIESQRAEAEADLSAALPAMEAAEAALKSINSNDITTVKKLMKPPPLIQRIMDAVLLLLHGNLTQLKPDPTFLPDRQLPVPSWQQSLSVMTQNNFLSQLLNYDRDAITDEMVEHLETVYLSESDFTLENAKKSCGNVAGLCAWVTAMCTYHNIAKVVEPKRAALREAESRKRTAMADLAEAQAVLDEKQAALDILQAKYDECIAEKQRLQDEADLTRRRLGAAEALIGGLSGERVRWAEEREALADRIRRLAGDVALATAFLNYAGPFNQEVRQQLLGTEWRGDLVRTGIPLSADINVSKFLADDTVVAQWQLEGLPTDDLSTQNGIIVTSGERYSLLIDPQGQAKQWIRAREEANGIIVTSENHRWFRTHLEDALNNGKPLLVEDVEETLDPVLTPILERQFLKSGSTLKVKVADKECDVTPGFRIYLASKLPNPHWAPELFARTSVIDFTVTQHGLEAQLLTRVVNKEKHELEEQRRALLEDVTSNRRRKLQLEEDLLTRLTSSTGNLLDDETLIDVLALTKRTTSEVDEKLQSAVAMEQRINDAREEYRSVATRGSLLYFLVSEMRLVEHMYQVSLFRFLRMFDDAIDSAEQTPVQAKRIGYILSRLTHLVWRLVTRGLYERHKLLFTLQLALKIDRRAGAISQTEFDCLVKGGAAIDLASVRKKPVAWLSDDAWLNVVALSEIPAFRALPDHIPQSESVWRRWCDTEAPETISPPNDLFTTPPTLFQLLLLVRALRPDRTILAASAYIASVLGAEFNESSQPDIAEVVRNGRALEPVVYLLSAGSDPTAIVEAGARAAGVELTTVSMGQGQEVRARALIRQAIANGTWLLLQNCHLSLAYMVELDARIAFTEECEATMTEAEAAESDLGFGVARPHPNFRLWITTEPSPKFPINMLQRSTLLTNEPPSGMRAGLRRSYNWITQGMIDSVDHAAWPALLYTVAFTHSVVQERRSFGPLGWNGCLSYEFNQSDLAASTSFVRSYLDSLEVSRRAISWPTVRYMICEVHYGGRITDDYDRRLMNTFGTEWFSDRVLEDKFTFCPGPHYSVPQYKELTVAQNFIEQLPALDTPEVVGLHSNAEIAFRASQTRLVLGTILAIQPKDASGSGDGRTREDVVDELAAETLRKMPESFPDHWVNDRIKALGGRAKPLNVFLGQEVARMEPLLAMVRKDLKELRQAIAGTVIMTPRLVAVMNAIYDAVVPQPWLDKSWPSPSVGFWFTGLTERCEQLRRWLENGRPNIFWLTGFFRPTSFLTAVRQEITRAHRWPLDTVNIVTELTRMEPDQVTAPPAEGVYVSGLFLDGAGWDRRHGSLTEQAPQQQHVALPVLHIYATNSPVSDKGMYRCPVYKTPTRTELNYVFDVLLPTDKPQAKWVLRGAAILCSTSG